MIKIDFLCKNEIRLILVHYKQWFIFIVYEVIMHLPLNP